MAVSKSLSVDSYQKLKIKALKSYPKIADDETKFAYEITKKKVTEQELTKEFQKQKKLWEKQNRPVSGH